MGFGLDHYQSYTQVCKKKKRRHDESQNLVNNQDAILPLDPVEDQPPLVSVASRMDEGMSVNQNDDNSESFEYYDHYRETAARRHTSHSLGYLRQYPSKWRNKAICSKPIPSEPLANIWNHTLNNLNQAFQPASLCFLLDIE